MKLVELIEVAIEAETTYGDMHVAFISSDQDGEMQMGLMDVCVSKVDGKLMFVFMDVTMDSSNDHLQ